MSIAQNALAPSKLRLERQVLNLTGGRDGVYGAHPHAAPDGAWLMFRGSSSINMALLAELSRSTIPVKTAKNRLWPFRKSAVR
jgi:hypothetical protein